MTYGATPGFGKIIIWLKESFSKIRFVSYLTKSIFLISTLSNFKICKPKKIIKFQKVIITWAKKSDFKEDIFYDSFSNLDSKKTINVVFFVIYLDHTLPNQIPNNVIIFYKPSYKYNLIFFLDIFFKKIKSLFFRPLLFLHYFSYQTIFAEIVNKHFLDVINPRKIKKIIMPYEGQPFQNFIFKNIKQINKKIETIGFVHSMMPALPLNFIKREGSPEKIYVSGSSQKNILVQYLGWKKKEIFITNSIRIKKKILKNQLQAFYFPMHIFKLNKVYSCINVYFSSLKKKFLPLIQIRKHPHMKNTYEQIILSKKIKALYLIHANKFSKKNKKKISFFLGPTSSFLQFLENNIEIIHITAMPTLDIYTNCLWRDIKPVEIANYTYKYSLLKKQKIIKLSNKYYSLKKAQIL